MDDLHRYLKSLGIPLTKKVAKNHPQTSPDPVLLPNNELIDSSYGTVYLVREKIPISDRIYSREIPAEIKKWLGVQNPIDSLANEGFLFVDVETSGDFGGAGVICFLVGIGQIVVNDLHLSQYLILHPEDEFAQLMELEKKFLSANGIITYNGKSFDLPLIQSRYQFHHIPLPTQELVHVDLLHLSRKIWKNGLQNRALRTMESTLLGIERSIDDIPGWMIPSIYRDFLLTQDASILIPVLYHNKMDVYSLVHLYLHITGLFTQALESTIENAETIFQLANFYHSIGETMQAIDAYKACQHYLKEDSQKLHLLENLAFLYKKLNQYEKAVETWQAAASLGSIKAYLELAKYYEHNKKDRAKACEWIESAIKILVTKKMDRFERSKWQAELQYRLERLSKTTELSSK